MIQETKEIRACSRIKNGPGARYRNRILVLSRLQKSSNKRRLSQEPDTDRVGFQVLRVHIDVCAVRPTTHGVCMTHHPARSSPSNKWTLCSSRS